MIKKQEKSKQKVFNMQIKLKIITNQILEQQKNNIYQSYQHLKV